GRQSRRGVGYPHAVRPGAAVAGPGGPAAGRGRGRGRRGPVGAVGVRALQQRLRVRHRRPGRPDGRRPGPGGGHRQPRPARAEGTVRQLAGDGRPGPADPAAGARGRRAGRVRLGHRDGPGRRAQPGAAGRARSALARLLHLRAAVPGGVLRARGHREGRDRHPAHGRQHAAVHGDRGGGDEGELRLRRAARQLRRHRRVRRDRPLRAQHARDADRAVGAGAGPDRRARPAQGRVRRPAGDRGGPARRRAPRRPQRDQPGADERAGAGAAAPRLGRRRVRRRAHPRPGRAARGRGAVDAGGGGRGVRGRRRGRPPRRGDHRDLRAGAVHRAAGLLPVPPGDGGVLRGEQPAPAARDDRPAGLRRPADERPADRAEHPRVRRGRRPAGLPQLGEPGPRRRAGPAVERRPAGHPALGAADPRDADLPVRRAGLHQAAVGVGDEPGGVHTRPGPDAPDPRRRRLPGGAGPLRDRDDPVRRRGAARGRLGREDRHLHQRQPHRAPVGPGRRPARRRPQRPRHLPRLRAADGLPGPRRGAADPVDLAGGGLPGLAGVQPRPAVRLHRHQLRPAARRERHPVAVQRRAPRRDRPAVRRRGVPHRPRPVRVLRPRPPHRGDRRPGGVPRAGAGRAGVPQGRAVPAAARGAGRGPPVPLQHRPHRLPLPHPDQDPPGPAARPGRAGRLGGAVRRRRRPARHRRGRHRAGHLPPGGDRRARQGGRRPGRGGLRALPLRRLRRGRAGRQRTDDDRVGPGLEAAGVQGGRGPGRAGPGRRPPVPGAHHHRVPPGRTGPGPGHRRRARRGGRRGRRPGRPPGRRHPRGGVV
ncbi:MAG: Assimilatory nitrate reductase large subunit, partial [uncultured Corynebacteriales bacterium]